MANSPHLESTPRDEAQIKSTRASLKNILGLLDQGIKVIEDLFKEIDELKSQSSGDVRRPGDLDLDDLIVLYNVQLTKLEYAIKQSEELEELESEEQQ